MMKKLLCTLLFSFFAIGISQAQNVFGEVSGRTGSSGVFTTIATTDATPPTNTVTTTEGTDYGSVTAGQISAYNDFEFSSLVASTLILSAEIVPGQLDADEFLLSNFVSGTVTGIGDTSIFQVAFEPDAASVGGTIKSAWVHVTVGTPPFGSPSEDYYFLLQGTVGAAAPGIIVLDNDNLPLTSGGTDPFGNAVGNVETVTRQYTIENDGTAPLTIQGITNAFGDTEFTVVLPGGTTFPFDIAIGSSYTFNVAFAPVEPDTNGEPDVNYSAFIAIDTETADAPNPFTDPTDFFFQVTGTGISPSPNMEVYGNSTLISSGDTTPSTGDDTVFTSVDIAAGGVTRTYTIENNGTSDVVLTSLSPIVNITGVDAADFAVTTNPTTPIAPGGSTTFVVTFDPTTVGLKNATVQINNNGVDNPYTFAIQGLALDGTVGGGSPLLITQYYEGTSSINNWIEVKNISATSTIAGSYYLAVFLNSNGTTDGGIETNSPDEVVSIPSLAAGEVIIFSRASATLPSAANLGPATIVETEVCTFTGNDVIVISTSSEGNAYNDRIDIMGVVGTNSAVNWGTDIALIKGCGTTVVPSTTYDEFQYIELTLDEVREANPNTNMALGTQTVGPTTWTSSWSNGVPDKTKSVIIDGTFNNSDGSFEACNLTINSGSSINLDSGGTGSNYVLVDQDLTINGTFNIGDTEALVMTDAEAVISGTISKTERTTPLNNFRDYTYWSSPVSTTIASAFTGVDPNRIWLWRTPVNETSSGAGDGDPGNWEIASGSMIEGRGYLAEAPSTITTGQQYEVTFTGTPNNGLVDVTVGIDQGQGDGYGGYNIVGNPYPSAIDIDLFLKEQANVEINNTNITTTDATIWLWTHGTQISNGTTGEFTAADYATYNLVGGVGSGNDEGTGVTPTNIIGSGQGFLINVIVPGNNEVTFENNMRVRGQNDTQFFKSSTTVEKDRIWLNMVSEDGKASNQILVGFMEEATDGVDRGYDGLHLGSGNVTFYSNLEDNIYAIQGLGAFDESKEVSLGFYSALENKHKISIGNAEGVLADQEIYLVDNELNVVHDLKQGAYEFDVTTAGNYQERFTLKFNSSVLSTEDLVLNNSFIVYNQDATLKIKAGTEISNLKVYDVTGRLLIDSEPNSATFDVPSQNIKAGTVLILNATMKDGATISKKAIKY